MFWHDLSTFSFVLHKNLQFYLFIPTAYVHSKSCLYYRITVVQTSLGKYLKKLKITIIFTIPPETCLIFSFLCSGTLHKSLSTAWLTEHQQSTPVWERITATEQVAIKYGSAIRELSISPCYIYIFLIWNICYGSMIYEGFFSDTLHKP